MANIADQIRLERQQIRTGLDLLSSNTTKLEDQSYASSSVYGNSCIKMMLPSYIERIKETTDRLHERKAGTAFKEIAMFLANISADEAAAISLKIAFDMVFSTKENANITQNVLSSIGGGIEAECQMRYYEAEIPDLYKFIQEKYWHSCAGTKQKAVLMKTLMNRKGVQPWTPWGNAVRVRLGGWLFDCLNETSGWFEKQIVFHSGRKKQARIVPSERLMNIKDQLLKEAELFSPVLWPMLIEPKDWSNEEPGGYILEELMVRNELVRRGNASYIQGDLPIAALNKAQRTAYRVNLYMLDVAEQLYAKGYKIAKGKFVPPYSEPIPPKPYDIAENAESRKTYRRARAEVENRNKAVFKRSCRTRMTMEAARRFKDVERFFIPHSFDYRGRMYPIPAFLTQMDTDFGKSLIRFSDESFMTPEAEDWLAFSVATCWGLDKAPMGERLAWTRDNHSLIKRIADDPIGTLSEWDCAEEPFQFLSACEEYTACVIDCTRHFTGYMVATDATCSGLQILAGLAKCRNTGLLTNVLDSPAPQDAYRVIADAARPNVPDEFKEHMDRKVTKRTVMTVPYNSKPFSNRSYIREALREKGLTVTTEDLSKIVSAVRTAMYDKFAGPMKVMDWIEKEVAKAFKRGVNSLTWTTPSGFVVHQELNKSLYQRITLNLFGRTNVRVPTGQGDQPDIKHHRNATSPNLIHSLDASLLQLSVLKFDAPIALIHDSVLCRATDMSELSSVVREVYMHLFAENDVLKDFANAIGAETEPPIIGDLEPESVIESTYFFC